MLKLIHIVFVFSSFLSFNIRMILNQFQPRLLQNRILKTIPHIIDTALLVSGLSLVFLENWTAREHGWIISKFIVLIIYIVFGIIAMRSRGSKRWLAFAAAIGCFAYIFSVAISKHGFI